MKPERTTFQVPTRDGQQLSTDAYGNLSLPRPVLLERTPYGKRDIRSSDQATSVAPVPTPEQQAEVFDKFGFTYVRQDCRGRGASTGIFAKYVHEDTDSVDTISWLRQQPWCDSRVFMTGVSYSAHAQVAAAAAGAAVSGLIIDSGGLWNPFETGIRVGGAFELKQATWAMRHALKSIERRSAAQAKQLQTVNLQEWFERMPWRSGDSPLTAAPEYEEYLFELWGHQQLKGELATPALNASAYRDAFPRIPAVLMGSWYDPYVRSTIAVFQHMSQRASGCRLILGPWTHGARVTTYAGDVEFGVAAAFDRTFGDDSVTWRAKWLADAAESVEPQSTRVDYFIMGGGSGTTNAHGRLEHGGEWACAEAWPPAGCTKQRFFFTREHELREQAHDDARLTLRHDPVHPVRTLGGQVTSGGTLMQGGGFAQSDADGVHVLSFRSAPLRGAVTIAGPIRAQLRVAIDARDVDLTAKLIDEYPESPALPSGFALNLSDGIMRARYREGFTRQVPVVPGEEFILEIALPDVANRFETGHRIRVDIAASNFPRFDINPGTGGAPWDEFRSIQIELQLGEESWIDIPVIASAA